MPPRRDSKWNIVQEKSKTLQESIDEEQKISDKTKKNIRRASITIDAILKLNPSLSSTGPVVDVDEDEKAKDGDVVKRKTKAKKERRKSLTDMCKDSSGNLTNDYWSKLQARLKVDEPDVDEEEEEAKKKAEEEAEEADKEKGEDDFKYEYESKDIVVEEKTL